MNFNNEMSLNKKEKTDLIKSLRELGIEDDDIVKALDIKPDEEEEKKSEDEEEQEEKSVRKSMKKAEDEEEEEEKSVRKSIKKAEEEDEEEKSEDEDEQTIDEKIAEKAEELKELQEMKKSMKKSIRKSLSSDDDLLMKSLYDKVDASDKKFDHLVDIVKGLADNIKILHKDNEKLIDENDKLRKSFGGGMELLEKLSQFTPGLKSAKGPVASGFHNRFEKSEDGKQMLSVTADKDKLSAILAKKMEDNTFIKSYGQDISNFECSGRVSQSLEKAIRDDLGINLVP
jgi:small-conductance mechanosensitive channel